MDERCHSGQTPFPISKQWKISRAQQNRSYNRVYIESALHCVQQRNSKIDGNVVATAISGRPGSMNGLGETASRSGAMTPDRRKSGNWPRQFSHLAARESNLETDGLTVYPSAHSFL